MRPLEFAWLATLGLVLLECLTGRKEFPGHAVAAAVARLLRDPVIPADLPAPWKSRASTNGSGEPAGSASGSTRIAEPMR